MRIVANEDYLYHVSYLKDLPSIQASGLVPGFGENWAGSWYQEYSKGRTFLTEESGISYWMSKMEQQATNNTDHPENGWIPVVLRFPDIVVLEDDERGTEDAMSESYYTEDEVPAEDIEVYDGTAWVPLLQVDLDSMWEKVQETTEIEVVDGEELHWPDFDVFTP